MGDSAIRHESGHWRNNSNVSGGDFSEKSPSFAAPPARRHDYPDFQNIDSDLGPRSPVSSSIPPPTLTVKSEFPTLSRSKVQQSLTCLVTLEVPEKKWLNYADRLPPMLSVPSTYDQQPPSPTARSQYSFERQDPNPGRPRDRDRDREREATSDREQELLATITEDLRQRVENWHGLDFNRSCSRTPLTLTSISCADLT